VISPRDPNSAPPLWVWLAVLVLLFALLGISFPILHKIHLDQFNPSRLTALKQALGKTPPKIVVIGSSLTRNALYKDEVMERFAAARGKPIRFLRFTELGQSLDNFREIAELVLEAAPDVICFESTLFSVSVDGHEGTDWRKKIANHRILLHELLRHWLLNIPCFGKYFEFLRLPKDLHGNFNDIGLNLKTGNTHGDFLKEKALAAKFRVRSFSEGQIYHDFFETAAKHGVKIIFIDLSRSKDKWDILSPMIESKIITLMNQYKKTYGVTYISFPYKLSLDYFVDYAHFGDKGREFYSGWFVEQLPKILSRESK
jgi:hypothetical protein